jgi:hypothetical protein
MMAAQNDLVLVVAENAALEFAGYGHVRSSRYLRINDARPFSRPKSSITLRIKSAQ